MCVNDREIGALWFLILSVRRGCTPTCVDVTFVWRSWYVGQEADVTNKWLDTASFRRHEISASTKSGPTQFVGYRDAESVLKMHGLTVSHLVPPMDDRIPLRILVTCLE